MHKDRLIVWAGGIAESHERCEQEEKWRREKMEVWTSTTLVPCPVNNNLASDGHGIASFLPGARPLPGPEEVIRYSTVRVVLY